ncbi:Apple-like protein [Gossypium australe]|uniref:non-specific serine/threonine protein kinase n=1 Tax=Gossypium australe TaxID=47621 RepID=A0A5B6V3U0_9ROSI|nr:Apple-like protein [Gossypium australe]
MSPDNTFTCGFNVVGENAYYFSIWFTNSKEKTVVWMANYGKPVNGKGSRVSLRRDGALVLTDVDGSTIWQTNTSSTDAQQAELLNNGNLLMYDGPDTSSLYWPDVDNTIFRNGRTSYNSKGVASLDDVGRFSSSGQLEFSASDLGLGIKSRLTIDYDGNLRLFSLNYVTGLWMITWEAVLQQCQVHGICGRNGICVNTPNPKCSCLPGYEITGPSNWNKGCKPRFNKTCSASQQPMTFMEIPHVDFYGYDIIYYNNKTFDWCKNVCINDNSCQAFSYNKIKGEGKCYTKANLRVTTYLKAPLCLETFEYIIPNGTGLTCSTKGTKPVTRFSSMYATKVKRMKWAYLHWFASVIGAIEMIFIVSGSWLLFKRHDVSDVVKEGYRVIASQFTKFSYSELKKATSNFKEELDERVVAVKKLGDAYLSEEVFWAEVSTIRKIYHMNLVRIESIIGQTSFLEKCYWVEREVNASLGTAKEWVIHCDVKPENILLDGEFKPEISDFGLAKLFQRDRKNPELSHIRAKGYMAPEWALNLPITAKVDVWNLKGIRLSNWVLEDGEEQETELTKFLRDIKRKIQSEEVAWIEDAVDTRLNGEFNRIQAEKMIEIGISCMEEDKNRRPTMDSIVQALLECEEGARVQSNPDHQQHLNCKFIFKLSNLISYIPSDPSHRIPSADFIRN